MNEGSNWVSVVYGRDSVVLSVGDSDYLLTPMNEPVEPRKERRHTPSYWQIGGAVILFIISYFVGFEWALSM